VNLQFALIAEGCGDQAALGVIKHKSLRFSVFFHLVAAVTEDNGIVKLVFRLSLSSPLSVGSHLCPVLMMHWEQTTYRE
jgi:hypothetical protein